MKTIIKKGQLLSKLTHVDEEVFKECLEEIFWVTKLLQYIYI